MDYIIDLLKEDLYNPILNYKQLKDGILFDNYKTELYSTKYYEGEKGKEYFSIH